MSKQLLILDDDTTFGPLLCRQLSKRGYQAQWVDSVSSALRLCNQQHFDLAVLDLKLEQETSLAFIPQLRRLFPQINILMLTGFASIATTVEAIKLGANNYLPKPASLDEILQALGETAEITAPISPAELSEAATLMSAKRVEWEHIQRVLLRNNGNISAAGRELNMHRRTLQRKLQKKPSRT